MPRGLLLLLLVCPASRAAWVSIQNASQETVTVQEIVIVYGKPELGKPVTLAPKETLRDYQSGAGTKTYRITAGKKSADQSVTMADKDLRCQITVTNGVPKLAIVNDK